MESNAQLVEKAVSLAAMFDREPATPDEPRSVRPRRPDGHGHLVF
ncbi:MAG: 3-keto-5-aminohexanoate cleavage protein [Rubrobacteraceae bacterium]